MNWLAQVVSVTSLNLRSLAQRLAPSVVAMVGIAGVVGVFVAVLSMAEGFRATLTKAGSPDTAIVMRGGTDTEMNSILQRDATRIVADAPGVRRSAAGPLASAELLVLVDLPKRSTGTEANVPLRGVQDSAFTVRDEIRIVAGRKFQSGRSEIIVGRAASAQFAGLDLGASLRWGENTWAVVGIFDSGGTVAESEIWCDVDVLQPAYRRGDSFQAVYAKLQSADSFTTFSDALTSDPRLDVKIVREGDYYQEQSTQTVTMITTLGLPVVALMAVGAIFGALNTMYSAVAARTREIATLRALGFGGAPIVISVMIEAMFLSLIGGIIGGIVAYLGFNGFQTSTMNWQSFSQVAFAFAVTPALLAQGVLYALIMGFIGGLFPAIRAARLPIVNALREL